MSYEEVGIDKIADAWFSTKLIYNKILFLIFFESSGVIVDRSVGTCFKMMKGVSITIINNYYQRNK